MKRIVIKLGTGVLSTRGGRSLDKKQFARIAEEVSAIMRTGTGCILVSSAAIAAGIRVLGLDSRPTDLPGKQACAAAGQPELMRLYASSFARHGRRVAQLLLTHGDLDSRCRRENARNTLDHLLRGGVVPIVNENDTVAIEELRFGDNDRLSADVAILAGASHLLILTGVDGLQDAGGNRIPLVRDITRVQHLVRPDIGAQSVGGMATKLEAAGRAVAAGIPAWIIEGRTPGRMADALANRDTGTRFPTPR